MLNSNGSLATRVYISACILNVSLVILKGPALQDQMNVNKGIARVSNCIAFPNGSIILLHSIPTLHTHTQDPGNAFAA